MTKFDVDERLVRKLANLLKETGLVEIEFESDGKRIRVNANAPVVATAPAAPAAPAAVGAQTAAARTDASLQGAVTSPMVGTVYLSPEPGSTAFVKIGDRVAKGQTILIIEAMKVMNPIPAPESGTVQEILAIDGQPVEFGEPLMIIQ
jgi:acetyl-CoA carboxylase biotin carboxyl carrier protein